MTLLITDAERAQLITNGYARTNCDSLDPIPVVHLFAPDARAT
jgi:hypothetical protein